LGPSPHRRFASGSGAIARRVLGSTVIGGMIAVYVAKNAPERVNDVAWRKIARRHLMQHGCEENEILATD
jgi:hypothetical protein